MFRIFDVYLIGKDQLNFGGMRIGGIYLDYCKKFVMYIVLFSSVLVSLVCMGVWVFFLQKDIGVVKKLILQMYGDVCNFNNLLFFFIYDNIKFRYIGLVRGLLGVYMYVEM